MANAARIVRTALLPLAIAGLAAGCLSCSAPEPARPNVLWIVWDTVRSDHIGLYGYRRDTTPHLDAWAADARVFEDCLSTAGNTMPSHASMFTGLLPSEHCTHNGHKKLGDEYETIAELLQAEGYRTFLFSANPHVSKLRNLAQGFETIEHPWSPNYLPRAVQALRDRLPEEDESSELRDRLRQAEQGGRKLTQWQLKSAGSLVGEAALSWLDTLEGEQPYFVFLNYMEAHLPFIPPRRYRERLMSPEEVEQSYRVDRSWAPLWDYTFGLGEYTDEEIELTRATYDATLAELDDLFHELMTALDAAGHLENTIVILTSDHGEHLGEQHMLDHQHSVYQALLRVPLIVHYPPAMPAGRESRPVMNFDIFPTLLELTGIDGFDDRGSRAVSLLHPEADRARFAEDPAPAEIGLRSAQRRHPGWDASPWVRSLRAFVVGEHKYIHGSDGRGELFDVGADPHEGRDLAGAEADRAGAMLSGLESYHAALDRCDPGELPAPPQPTPEQLELLRGLGYVE